MTTTRTTSRKPHGVKAIKVRVKSGYVFVFPTPEDAADVDEFLTNLVNGNFDTIRGEADDGGYVVIPWHSVDFIRLQLDPAVRTK